ncbi:MAG: hypothetical protein RL563_2083 [Pseudomonadota bacterium]
MMSSQTQNEAQQIILDAIAHLDHVLPGQAPIHNFVHHNTLHGFQHLPFEEALREFTALTGIECYLPRQQFIELYRQGRIQDEDLNSVLQQQFAETLNDELHGVTRLALYRSALLEDLSPIQPAQWQWQMAEAKEAQSAEILALWQTLLDKMALTPPTIHAEELLDLSIEQAESWAGLHSDASAQLQAHCLDVLETCWQDIGHGMTLRGLFLALAGKDILDSVRPQLIRLCASALDEGLAAWHLPDRDNQGLYAAWRQCLQYDAQAFFHELTDWQNITRSLPESALDAIAQQLEAQAIPRDRWADYLQRLALELPGWSGLINWRQTHPEYSGDDATHPQLMDYLAIRLILDRLYLQPLCLTLWHCDARLDKLKQYFTQHVDEFFVRYRLFQGHLPEYLTQAAQALLADDSRDRNAWRPLAERIWTWQHSPLAHESLTQKTPQLNALNQGWRLFKLCQALQKSATEITKIETTHLEAWLTCIDHFTIDQQQYVWLCAYEHHYQQSLLQALKANLHRGRWATRESRPQAQVFFCMDEREESFRRHLEEVNPAIETLGAAGFFGVAMNYKALDARHATPLCPVVVKPSHTVHEVLAPAQSLQHHQNGLQRAEKLVYLLYQASRRHPALAYLNNFLLGPLKLAQLLMKSFTPSWIRQLEQRWQQILVPSVSTQLQFSTTDSDPETQEPLHLGFSDEEQADRLTNFLKTTGLSDGFAPIIVIIGHGSTSQNNPHEAAHDCGACGGRQGGPNARVFAAMANRPAVRALLSARDLHIPADSWFVGAQHDTCSDVMTWYDLSTIPSERRDDFQRIQQDLHQADARAAIERCRRFASSRYPKTPKLAIRHVENRATDLSQVRPEFGHATNAAAFIGRRSATQGVFFDRRLFLISYDPTQDAEGTILENILLTAGPVGAGINLEYYFSSVNNERLGCSTKIPHNVTGLFGVMEGATSDLRTGLPLQMVEIHEAMRLQIVVESSPAILTKIYQRQPALQELVGGGWVHLSCLEPNSGEIFVFERGQGFIPWHRESQALPMRLSSDDCYRDSVDYVTPMLIQQATAGGLA